MGWAGGRVGGHGWHTWREARHGLSVRLAPRAIPQSLNRALWLLELHQPRHKVAVECPTGVREQGGHIQLGGAQVGEESGSPKVVLKVAGAGLGWAEVWVGADFRRREQEQKKVTGAVSAGVRRGPQGSAEGWPCPRATPARSWTAATA